MAADRLTDEQIAELERLLADEVLPWSVELFPSGTVRIIDARSSTSACLNDRELAALIVAAVNALPVLLAERETLREAIEETLAVLPDPRSPQCGLRALRHAVKVASARLVRSLAEDPEAV